MSANEFPSGNLTLDETLKILSLLNNPPEAAMIRKALRFYEIPKELDYAWGDEFLPHKFRTVWEILCHFAFPQSRKELDWMLGFVKGKTSLLEIGSSFGGTLKELASVMMKGSTIVSVDLDCDTTPKCLHPLDSLKETCRQLSTLGANVELIIGDSHSQQVVNRVADYAPYDFVFIDGDHTYEGVKQDWENYGPMGRIVGFHDIGGPLDDMRRFWNELKDSGEYRTEECIDTVDGPEGRKAKFGIGIVHME